jgi:DNA-binding NarL/FixJ family response regulator
VARALGIRDTTARHYTESVLLKLGVPSRSAVAAAILGAYERTGEHRAAASAAY